MDDTGWRNGSDIQINGGEYNMVECWFEKRSVCAWVRVNFSLSRFHFYPIGAC